jgi:LDH2 family malate/lactate/ureidoglycolate dehydrogenase
MPGEAGICHYFAAIDYGIFGDKRDLKNALSVFLRELRATPKADGKDRIYTHGERARETMAKRLRDFIPVSKKTLQEMKSIAKRQGADTAMLPPP